MCSGAASRLGGSPLTEQYVRRRATQANFERSVGPGTTVSLRPAETFPIAERGRKGAG